MEETNNEKSYLKVIEVDKDADEASTGLGLSEEIRTQVSKNAEEAFRATNNLITAIAKFSETCNHVNELTFGIILMVANMKNCKSPVDDILDSLDKLRE